MQKLQNRWISLLMSRKLGTRKTKLLRIRAKNNIRLPLLAFLLLCLACACSRPIKPKSDFITIKLGDLSFTRYFDLFEQVEFEGAETIRLSDFIDSAITDHPRIYAYRIIGSDGFYAALKGSPDNTWEHMQKGYLKLSDRKATFEPTLGLIGRYYVRDVASIELLRKIDTKLGEEKDTTFLIIDMEVETYSDPQDEFYDGRRGIRLSDFVEPLTSSPDNYSYNLMSVQGDQKAFSWSEIQTGWWLVDLDLIKFSPDLGPNSRIPRLLKVELIPMSE
jgi:hypothetical protein